jgi:hypothetical protein
MPKRMSDILRQIPMKSFSQLKGKTFIIPSQQRGYKWTSTNIEELITDLWEFINAPDNKKMYCLQPLAIVPQGNAYSVLDGQQRLTTLFLLYKYLSGKNAYSITYERDEDDLYNLKNRWDFLSNISIETDYKLADSQIDLYYIFRAYKTIASCFVNESGMFSSPGQNVNINIVKSSFLDLLDDKSDKKVQVIWYEVHESKAHETFRNLNSGKISLTNTELIKALFLNRVSGLNDSDRENAARQFEEMEQVINKDHFWAMLSSEEPRFPHTRMDLFFNLVANVKENDCEKDHRTSFRWFADFHNGSLEDKWEQVRHTFLRLYDMYENTYTYHYLGYLTYCNQGSRYKFLKDILHESRVKDKTEFISELRKLIRKTINPNDDLSVSSFEYEKMKTYMLRRFYLLHNIESILQKYDILKSDIKLSLQHEYEQFPFELLHKQNWDIEHITSQTNSSFDNEQDRNDWLRSVRADYPHYFDYEDGKAEANRETDRKAQIKYYLKLYERNKTKSNFDNLYKTVISYNDEQEKDHIEEEKKNQPGNLVLLDSHTNRSFHNSLFPRKRRIVVIANGLKSNDDEKNIKQVYVPPCTLQCFTKEYSKNSSTKLNAWLQTDADAYINDIRLKLCDDKSRNIVRYFSE